MAERTEYHDGDVVWVKLSNCWWPGEVCGETRLPEDLLLSLKKRPIAVVKFFQEDTFEYVKSMNNIFKYNCFKKHDFIKRGLEQYRAKNKHMDKFPADVSTAEKLTGGDPDIIHHETFVPQKKESYANIFNNPSKRTRNKRGDISPRARKSRGSSISPTKSRRSSDLSPPRTARPDHEIRIMAQPALSIQTTPSTSSASNYGTPVSQYNCYKCGFESNRLNVIVLHTKHCKVPQSVPIKGKKIEENVATPSRVTKDLKARRLDSFELEPELEPEPENESEEVVNVTPNSRKSRISTSSRRGRAISIEKEEVETILVIDDEDDEADVQQVIEILDHISPIEKTKTDEELKIELLADWSEDDLESGEDKLRSPREKLQTDFSDDKEIKLDEANADVCASSQYENSSLEASTSRPSDAASNISPSMSSSTIIKYRNIPKKQKREYIEVNNDDQNVQQQALSNDNNVSSTGAGEKVAAQSVSPSVRPISAKERILNRATRRSSNSLSVEVAAIDESATPVPPISLESNIQSTAIVAEVDSPKNEISCFDFKEDEEEELVLTKSPRRSLSTRKESVVDHNLGQPNVNNNEMSEDKELEKKDTELKTEIESLLCDTSVPKLPDLPKLPAIPVFSESVKTLKDDIDRDRKLPPKERGKRIFKSRNKTIENDVIQMEQSKAIVLSFVRKSHEDEMAELGMTQNAESGSSNEMNEEDTSNKFDNSEFAAIKSKKTKYLTPSESEMSDASESKTDDQSQTQIKSLIVSIQTDQIKLETQKNLLELSQNSESDEPLVLRRDKKKKSPELISDILNQEEAVTKIDAPKKGRRSKQQKPAAVVLGVADTLIEQIGSPQNRLSKDFKTEDIIADQVSEPETKESPRARRSRKLELAAETASGLNKSAEEEEHSVTTRKTRSHQEKIETETSEDEILITRPKRTKVSETLNADTGRSRRSKHIVADAVAHSKTENEKIVETDAENKQHQLHPEEVEITIKEVAVDVAEDSTKTKGKKVNDNEGSGKITSRKSKRGKKATEDLQQINNVAELVESPKVKKSGRQAMLENESKEEIDATMVESNEIEPTALPREEKEKETENAIEDKNLEAETANMVEQVPIPVEVFAEKVEDPEILKIIELPPDKTESIIEEVKSACLEDEVLPVEEPAVQVPIEKSKGKKSRAKSHNENMLEHASEPSPTSKQYKRQPPSESIDGVSSKKSKSFNSEASDDHMDRENSILNKPSDTDLQIAEALIHLPDAAPPKLMVLEEEASTNLVEIPNNGTSDSLKSSKSINPRKRHLLLADEENKEIAKLSDTELNTHDVPEKKRREVLEIDIPTFLIEKKVVRSNSEEEKEANNITETADTTTDEDKLFDINSMPIVMDNQELTADENDENNQMFMAESPKTADVSLLKLAILKPALTSTLISTPTTTTTTTTKKSSKKMVIITNSNGSKTMTSPTEVSKKPINIQSSSVTIKTANDQIPTSSANALSPRPKGQLIQASAGGQIVITSKGTVITTQSQSVSSTKVFTTSSKTHITNSLTSIISSSQVMPIKSSIVSPSKVSQQQPIKSPAKIQVKSQKIIHPATKPTSDPVSTSKSKSSSPKKSSSSLAKRTSVDSANKSLFVSKSPSSSSSCSNSSAASSPCPSKKKEKMIKMSPQQLREFTRLGLVESKGNSKVLTPSGLKKMQQQNIIAQNSSKRRHDSSTDDEQIVIADRAVSPVEDVPPLAPMVSEEPIPEEPKEEETAVEQQPDESEFTSNVQESSQLIAVPAENFGGPANLFYLCSVGDEGFVPVNNELLYLDSSNQLVALSEQPPGEQADVLEIPVSEETVISTDDSTDPSQQSFLLNTQDGQQIILDQQSLMALAAGGDASQLLTPDGQQILLQGSAQEFLAALSVNQPGIGIVAADGSQILVAPESLIDIQAQAANQDILATALANTNVYHQDQLPGEIIQINPNTTVETNAILTKPPIMSAVEVPTKNNVDSSIIEMTSSSLDDSLAAVIGVTSNANVPTSLELPITVTNPAIAKTTTAIKMNTIYPTTTTTSTCISSTNSMIIEGVELPLAQTGTHNLLISNIDGVVGDENKDDEDMLNEIIPTTPESQMNHQNENSSNFTDDSNSNCSEIIPLQSNLVLRNVNNTEINSTANTNTSTNTNNNNNNNNNNSVNDSDMDTNVNNNENTSNNSQSVRSASEVNDDDER